MTQIGTAMQWNALWYCDVSSLNFAFHGHDTKMNCIHKQMPYLKINAQPNKDKQRLNNVKTLYKNRLPVAMVGNQS